MLKLRLARIGRKKQPVYRLVIIEHSARRGGRPVDSVGYYNPLTKELNFKTDKIQKWLSVGVKPSETVISLLKKAQVIK